MLKKFNLRVSWNHAMNFEGHGQCDSIIFPEIFSLGSSKYFLDLPLVDNRMFLTGPVIYPPNLS